MISLSKKAYGLTIVFKTSVEGFMLLFNAIFVWIKCRIKCSWQGKKNLLNQNNLKGFTSGLTNYSKGNENRKEREEPHKDDTSHTMHGWEQKYTVDRCIERKIE